jgi:hypothetical protein
MAGSPKKGAKRLGIDPSMSRAPAAPTAAWRQLALERVVPCKLTLQDNEIRVADERHYLLVRADHLDQQAIGDYRA